MHGAIFNAHEKHSQSDMQSYGAQIPVSQAEKDDEGRVIVMEGTASMIKTKQNC